MALILSQGHGELEDFAEGESILAETQVGKT
jgi:hypothetical protein